MGGRRIETRLIERRADKSWSYLSYVWNDDGTEAVLAPARGLAMSNVGGPAGRYLVPLGETASSATKGQQYRFWGSAQCSFRWSGSGIRPSEPQSKCRCWI